MQRQQWHGTRAPCGDENSDQFWQDKNLLLGVELPRQEVTNCQAARGRLPAASPISARNSVGAVFRHLLPIPHDGDQCSVVKRLHTVGQCIYWQARHVQPSLMQSCRCNRASPASKRAPLQPLHPNIPAWKGHIPDFPDKLVHGGSMKPPDKGIRQQVVDL